PTEGATQIYVRPDQSEVTGRWRNTLRRLNQTVIPARFLNKCRDRDLERLRFAQINAAILCSTIVMKLDPHSRGSTRIGGRRKTERGVRRDRPKTGKTGRRLSGHAAIE